VGVCGAGDHQRGAGGEGAAAGAAGRSGARGAVAGATGAARALPAFSSGIRASRSDWVGSSRHRPALAGAPLLRHHRPTAVGRLGSYPMYYYLVRDAASTVVLGWGVCGNTSNATMGAAGTREKNGGCGNTPQPPQPQHADTPSDLPCPLRCMRQLCCTLDTAVTERSHPAHVRQ